MNNQNEVYHTLARKRELLEMLKENFNWVMDASDKLEKKAWDILGVSTATFGIVSAIEITLKPQNVSDLFWKTLFISLMFYGLQVAAIIQVIRPREWHRVPGTPDGTANLQSLAERYLSVSEDKYLNRLIADYVGSVHPDDPKKPNEGAIAKAEKNNKAKSFYIQIASILLVFIILGLVGMAVAANM